MTRYATFLRGVNVGGNNRLPMDDFLRQLQATELQNISTVIQSGNVVYDAEDRSGENNVKMVLKSSFQLDVPLFTFSVADLEQILAKYPFDHTDDTYNHNIIFTNLFDFDGFLAEITDEAKQDVQIKPPYIFWRVEKGDSTSNQVAKVLQKPQFRAFHTIRTIKTVAKIVG